MELTHKNLSLKELTQLALVEIYKDYQKHKCSENIYMGEIRTKLGLKEYDDRIFQITDLLEELRFIEKDRETADGLAFVKLMPNAIVYMEETGDTSINNAGNMSERIILNFFNKVERSQINTQSSGSIQYNIKNDLAILDKVIEVIKSSTEINTSDKNDLFADIAIIKNEVTKSKPDKTLLEKRIELWSKFIPLVPYIPIITEWIKNL